ncbi:MAG: protein TonB [Patiriisocius sp.]
MKKNIHGKVYVKFVVTKDGNVAKAEILRGICDDMESEVLKMIARFPKWVSGTVDGEPVDVWYTLPINFKFY